MSDEFKGRRALVTGAGKGIGRATAIRLAQLGAKVFALSRTQSDLDSLKEKYPEIEVICVDLADWTKTREAVQKVTPIHLLVNNAAICQLKPLVDVIPDEFDQMFNVNVKAVLNVSQVVAQNLLEREEKGTIVNISSTASFRGFPTISIYGATKSAMDSLTQTMAAEWSCKGIRVNSLNPTLILTDMGKNSLVDGVVNPKLLERTPQGKIAEVEHAVNGIVFLLSDKSDMINGHKLPVDGGLLCC